jgi:hypothetical protein
MLPLLALSAAGMALDDRLITGAPAWLKPAKFAASVAIYSLTLAALFTALPAWPRLRRVIGWTTAVALVFEMAIIVGQALRGVPSHFNVATPLDAALFYVMGAVIFTQTFATVAVGIALWRTRFTDAALGWALRWGHDAHHRRRPERWPHDTAHASPARGHGTWRRATGRRRTHGRCPRRGAGSPRHWLEHARG